MAIALAAAGCTLGAAAPAGAWWAEGTNYKGIDGAVFVYAEPGEVNDLRARDRQLTGLVRAPWDGVRLHDPTAPVTPPPAGRGKGCKQLDAHTLFCTGVGLQGGTTNDVVFLNVDLGDGDDRLVVERTGWLFKLGSMGSGNDVVDAYDPAGADIDLGDGDDSITLRGSDGGFLPSDSVYGGAGDDVLNVVNGAADDNPICADGNDTLYADPGESGESGESCETRYETQPSFP
ncbi:MAG TPA: hypothetical protein VF715_09425 [Thermoleophilaceae bacterium]